MRHYVYVTKGECGRHYVGVRSCKCDPAEDSYMGSHKDPDYSPVEKWIWSEFDTREDAANAEASLHEVFDVAVSPHFANRCKALPNGGLSRFGTTHSEETKRLQSKLKKGRKLSEEHKKNISLGGLRRYSDPEERIKTGLLQMGDKNVSKRPEVRALLSKQKKEKNPMHDPKLRERVSEAMKGLKRFHSPITGERRMFHPGKQPPEYVLGWPKNG